MGRPHLGISSGIIAASALLAATAIALPRSAADPKDYSYCPPAGHLIHPTTRWHHHRLAPGVTLSEATVRSRRGPLNVSVVDAHLGRRTVRVRPLHRSLTSRRRLSQLAHRRHLVAATNGVYFNFGYGAPTVPFIDSSGPVVLSRHRRTVAGIGTDGRARAGQVWLRGHVQSVHGRHRLGAINEVTPPRGLSLYTSAWGPGRVPLPLFARSRPLRHGHPIGPIGRRHRVPKHGDLLVGSSRAAIAWLRRLPGHSPVSVVDHARTDAPDDFAQAYGVGTQVVAAAGHIRSGLYCRRSEIFAARTDIAWTDHGRHLILATVVGRRGGENHGVDENQMSEIMVHLGAARSYALDGGGSTELVARLHHSHGLSVRTHRFGVHERRIPLGIGVYSLPKSQVRKHSHHRAAHHPARKPHPTHHKPKHKRLLPTLPPLP